jgi:endonuclease/exonuclease/phosphatase (EEP) superfamily protein YafD
MISRLTLLLLIITLLSFGGNYTYIFELFSHFKPQYLFLFLLSIGFFSLCYQQVGAKKWLLISIFGFSLNAVVIFPLYLAPKTNASIKAESQKFSVLLSNVLTSNQSKQKLVTLIKKQQADIVVALEINTLWANALKIIKADYPYQSVIPRDDNFGIGIYSKHPLTQLNRLDFANNDLPSLTALVRLNGTEIQLIATHPLPPFNEIFAVEQKNHFQALAEYINQRKSPVIVAGDLNTALWSSAYKGLMTATGLKNTRQGYGIIPSWSVGSILQLALDHVLISESIQTTRLQTMESIDSDHLPLYVELIIP